MILGKLIDIRKFKENDALKSSNLIRKTLIEINSKHYPDSVINYLVSEFSPEFMLKLSNERDFFVAAINNRIVGTATLLNDYIGTVFVDPEVQGRGIGSKLMETLENLAIQRKVKALKLHSSISAINFYEKLGYLKGKKNVNEEYGITYEMIKLILS